MATLRLRKRGKLESSAAKGEAIADPMGYVDAGAHEIALLGPLTVPQIARMRPTSRQRMQRLADELSAEGLVKFVDNPKHRRSKLVQRTRKGHERYRELNARFLGIASTMGVALGEGDIRKTTEIVRQLSDDVKAR